MAFNENTFMLAGTAIAIAGVGLYIYDTRKDSVANAYNSYKQPQTTPYQPVPAVQSAGSKKHRKKNSHKKTKKR
jgi:hypothetical protein